MRLAALWLTLSTATALALSGASAAADRSGGVSYLANETIRVGVDLDDGGKISYLARSRVPAADLIDGVQQSYYDGNWHVAAAGGQVLVAVNDDRTIYTKVLPNSDDDEPCACVFETWVTLQGSSVQVLNRLTSDRRNTSPQPPTWQELPALYTTGTAYRLITYDGPAPYTGAPVRRIGEHPGRFFAPGSSFAATEHWAALVGTGGRGVGLFVPDVSRFSGIPGTSAGVERAGPNGYLTATTPEILDGPVAYSYRYALVLGTVRQIRAYAVAHRPDDRPAYRFRTNRRHWWPLNTADEGSPHGALRIRLEHDDPQLIGPEQRWEAKTAPLLYVRGAWHTSQSLAEVYWSVPGRTFDAPRSAVVAVIPDGRFHTYRIRLAASRLYTGTIDGLRLDPVVTQDIGGFVDLSCISWKPCPVDRASEAQLEHERLPYPFREDFERGLGPIWHTSGSGTGATLATANGRLEVTVQANAANGPPGGWIGAHIGTNCRLVGDFDVQVDYELLTWPAANGVAAFMNTYYGPAPNWESINRESLPWAELYETRIAGSTSSTLTNDLRGTMRLTRTGSILAASSRTASTDWQLVATRMAVLDPAVITLGAASNDTIFAHRDVKVAFDNFSVNTGRLSCP
jgi:hypothetical protein